MCDKCEALAIENQRLRRELRLRADLAHLHAVQVAFGLTLTESRLLMMLYDANGRVVGTGLLVDELVGLDAFPDVLKTHVCRVRKKCGDGLIDTVHGLGYQLNPVGRARVYRILNKLDDAA